MTMVVLRSIFTLLLFAVFVGIVVWAYARRNRARFDEAARLPFADEPASQPPVTANQDKP